jgi:hypothetical protein
MLDFDIELKLKAANQKEVIAKAKAAQIIANNLEAENIEFLAKLSGDAEAINKLLSNQINRLGLKREIKKYAK